MAGLLARTAVRNAIRICRKKSKTKMDMKTTDNKQKKQFKQLSDEELEQVNGGGIPEKCKDPEYVCSHMQVCKFVCMHST